MLTLTTKPHIFKQDGRWGYACNPATVNMRFSRAAALFCKLRNRAEGNL